MGMSKMFIQIFLFLFSTTISLSQIKINEYSVSNATVGVSGPTFIDNQGNTPDWIELYNPTSSGINIAGYNLTDNPINISKYTFPIGTIIPANGFLRVWCSGKGTPANSGGNIHTNFSLSQCNSNKLFFNLSTSDNSFSSDSFIVK